MKTIYSSGIAVAVTPFLGIPYSWKTILLVALGLIIFIKGYSYYKKSTKKVKQLEASFEQNEKPTEPVIRDISVDENFNVLDEELGDNYKEVEENKKRSSGN